MNKQPLYFDNMPFFSPTSSQMWVAQPSVRGWTVISPDNEELGSIDDDGYAYLVTSEQLGIRSVQRKTVRDCVAVVACALYSQNERQRKLKNNKQQRTE